jgi:hypothetical protein
MVKKISVALFVCMGISVFAVNPSARLDLDGRKDKIKLTINQKPVKGVGYNPTWIKEGKDYFIYTQSAALKSDDWEIYEIAFTPDKDGFVIISLKGVYHKPKGEEKNKPVWNYWDNVVVEGAEIINGDFEKLDQKGKPEGWSVDPENVIKKDKNKFIKVWHNKSANQKIKVTKNQKVTIKAKVKKLEE